eukprot:m.1209073 g.1209073  ORF g.1209073 m.1209073 type:complete len:565 (-) comp24590_c2_seq16:1380-3074(-)
MCLSARSARERKCNPGRTVPIAEHIKWIMRRNARAVNTVGCALSRKAYHSRFGIHSVCLANTDRKKHRTEAGAERLNRAALLRKDVSNHDQDVIHRCSDRPRRYVLPGIPSMALLPKSLGDLLLTPTMSLRRFITANAPRRVGAHFADTTVRTAADGTSAAPMSGQRTRQGRLETMLQNSTHRLSIRTMESVPEYLLRTMDLALRGVETQEAVRSEWCTTLQTVADWRTRMGTLLDALGMIFHRSGQFRIFTRSDSVSATHVSRGRERPWEDGETAMTGIIAACIDLLQSTAPPAQTPTTLCQPSTHGKTPSVATAATISTVVAGNATGSRCQHVTEEHPRAAADHVLCKMRLHIAQLVANDAGRTMSEGSTPARVGRIFGRLCRQYRNVAQLLAFAHDSTCIRETYSSTIFIAVMGAFPEAGEDSWVRFPRPAAVEPGDNASTQTTTHRITSPLQLRFISIQLTALRWLLTPSTGVTGSGTTGHGIRGGSGSADGGSAPVTDGRRSAEHGAAPTSVTATRGGDIGGGLGAQGMGKDRRVLHILQKLREQCRWPGTCDVCRHDS